MQPHRFDCRIDAVELRGCAQYLFISISPSAVSVKRSNVLSGGLAVEEFQRSGGR